MTARSKNPMRKALAPAAAAVLMVTFFAMAAPAYAAPSSSTPIVTLAPETVPAPAPADEPQPAPVLSPSAPSVDAAKATVFCDTAVWSYGLFDTPTWLQTLGACGMEIVTAMR